MLASFGIYTTGRMRWRKWCASRRRQRRVAVEVEERWSRLIYGHGGSTARNPSKALLIHGKPATFSSVSSPLFFFLTRAHLIDLFIYILYLMTRFIHEVYLHQDLIKYLSIIPIPPILDKQLITFCINIFILNDRSNLYEVYWNQEISHQIYMFRSFLLCAYCLVILCSL